MSIPSTTINWKDYVGRFPVEFDVANFRDLVQVETGAMAADQVRRIRISGVVDTGATRLVLPGRVAATLGLSESGQIGVRYADGRTAQRAVVDGVQVTLGERSSVFTAVIEPDRTDALIGAIVLEELDLLPDCTNQKLIPRDPHGLFAEIE